MPFPSAACDCFSVVPVLTGPLQALLAMLPAILLAMLGVLVSLFKPSVLKAGLRLLWRLKVPVGALVVGTVGAVWAARSFWPEAPTPDLAIEAGSDWPLFRGGPERTGAVPETPEPARGGLHWALRRGKTGFLSSPAVVGNRVYVSTATTAIIGGGSGEIYCLDADTGEVAWHAAPPGYRATFSSPVVSGDYLVCGEGLHFTRDSRIVCLDLRPGREGEVLWTHRTDSHVECTPVIHNGRVYIGAGDDGYYCLRLEPDAGGRAQVVWHVPGDDYPDAETSLIAHGDRLYAGLGLGGKAICVLDAATGRELARIDTGLPVFGPPAIAGGKLYVGMGNGDYVHRAEEIGAEPLGEVWCVDLKTIKPDWKHRVGRTVLGAVAVRGDRLYFGSRDGYLYCVSTGGEPVAKFATHAPLIASPAVTDRHVFCVAESGMIYCLDRQTLELVWEFRLGTTPLFISSPAVARGHVYVGTQFDDLLCVGRPGEPGEQPAQQQPLWPGRLGGPRPGGNSDDSPLARLGVFQWQYPTGQTGESDAAMVAAPVAVAGDDLVVPLAGREGRRGVACLPADLTDVDTPKPRWVYKTPNPVVRSPAVCGDTVFLVDGEPGQTGRALHAVDRSTGELRWKTTVGTDAAGTLCCTRDEVFVEDEPGGLSRFDFDGNRQWTAAVGPTARAPAVSEQLVAAAVVDPPGLVLLDRPTGRVLWRAALDGRPTTAPLPLGDRVLVGTEAALEGRSLVDGRPLPDWQAGAADVPGVASDLVLDGDAVLFVSTGGKLVCVGHGDGAGRFQIDGARPGVAPLVSRGTVLYVGAESLMSFTPGQHDATPGAWADVSWLGRPVTPMVLSRSNVYLGMAGWGLVRFGASP